MTITGIFQYDPDDGTKGAQLTLLGELQGYNPDGSGIYAPLEISFIGEGEAPRVPGGPTLAAVMPSRTTSTLTWQAFIDTPSTPPVTSWEIERRASTDGGTVFGAWAPISGSPFAATPLTRGETGLPTGTPEVVFGYRVRGVNSIGDGLWSNEARVGWTVAPPAQPTAPSGFSRGLVSSTTVNLSWSESVDASVTKHGLFQGTTLLRDNLGATLLAYQLTGMTPGQTLTNLNVRRWNGQWSPSSNTLTFTLPLINPVPFTMLMGVSDSAADSGGTLDWDAWRAYTQTKMMSIANRTGVNRPLLIAYSKDGANLGGTNPTYAAVFAEVTADLNQFYYDGTAATHSARWGIKLYWSNGNENSDKGALGPSGRKTAGTATNIPGYIVSQQALYDAVHQAPGGVRRFPDAYAGSNPTQEHERTGIVQEWLHPSARYHDFVMWSMYPPGRGVNDPALSRNPRWDWPSFAESARTQRQPGFLIRPFYRTYQAQLQARTDTGDPNFALIIGCGEAGMASNPDDRTTRPYYAVHALAGGMWILANQYGLAMNFACWWDNQTADTAPHNILSDEPPTSDHLDQGTGAVLGNNATATNPSTREAWQNWMLYDKRQPGSSQPAQWVNNPKATWNFTGTQV